MCLNIYFAFISFIIYIVQENILNSFGVILCYVFHLRNLHIRHVSITGDRELSLRIFYSSVLIKLTKICQSVKTFRDEESHEDTSLVSFSKGRLVYKYVAYKTHDNCTEQKAELCHWILPRDKKCWVGVVAA